jgi:hypothetical protein
MKWRSYLQGIVKESKRGCDICHIPQTDDKFWTILQDKTGKIHALFSHAGKAYMLTGVIDFYEADGSWPVLVILFFQISFL